MTAALTQDVAAVRAFNRFYTRRIGVLDDAHLGSGFTLGEGRVLYELAHTDGLTAKRLGELLDLDGGYLSRILRRFGSTGLIERRADPRDGRSSSLHLTPNGREAYVRLNASSEAQVAAMLRPLEDGQRDRLTSALRTVSGLLGPGEAGAAEIVLREHRPGDMGWLIQRHAELYADERGWGSLFEALVGEVCMEFVRNFDPERERCWIAEREGERLGCVMLVDGGEGIAKLRMLLVEPAARGLGLGRRLVAECIGFARQKGYREITLWTQSVLETARRIYADVGFELTDSQPHDLIGQPLIGETWTLKL
jgi:DNA-binding MarR family transcriptional regulator/predicted GNAT family acetyltransferase